MPVARVKVHVRTGPVDVRGVVGQRVGVRQRDGATDRAGFGVDPVTEVNGQRAESERLVVE